MWTCENRPKYNRDKLRYPSDLTDEEWSHVAPLIRPAKHTARNRESQLPSAYLTTSQSWSIGVVTSWILSCHLLMGPTSLATKAFIAPAGLSPWNGNSVVSCTRAKFESAEEVYKNTSVAIIFAIFAGGVLLVKIGSRSLMLPRAMTRSIAPAGGWVALYHSFGKSWRRSKKAKRTPPDLDFRHW